MRGKFITLEGIDGAGKSTHLAWLIDTLRGRGLTVVATREPGGTPLGEKLRELVLHQPMELETEALIMFAARREHLARVIRPALARGEWVVSDRFTDATYAYQGGGRGLSAAKIRALEDWVHPDLQPDATVLLDLPAEVACRRVANTGQAPDRFEREEEEFFGRVRQAYLDRAAQTPGRWHVIDASGSIADIQKKLQQVVAIICK